jgi:hypothetical protein
MKYIKLFEEFSLNDPDLLKLINLAKEFDDPYKFDKSLNNNEFGHDRRNSFLRERFLRLNRGTRLTGDSKIILYRAGQEPIKWGDYVYINYDDAQHAVSVGQGTKVYKKEVPKNDIIETSVDGEYYYSPRKISQIGKDLIDFWNYINNKKQPNDQNNSEISIKLRIKEFKKMLKILGKKYKNFNEYENEVFRLSNIYNIPFTETDYEQYFEE